MTTEEMNFWLEICRSPVAIALASGVAGSIVILIVTWLKFRHDSKESQKDWERQEEQRKGERAFEKKAKAYEDCFQCFETSWGMEPSNFDRYFIPRIMQLMVYGPLPVKKHARQAILHLVESKNYPSESNEYRSHIDKAKFHCDEIHTAMMEDMDSHFY